VCEWNHEYIRAYARKYENNTVVYQERRNAQLREDVYFLEKELKDTRTQAIESQQQHAKVLKHTRAFFLNVCGSFLLKASSSIPGCRNMILGALLDVCGSFLHITVHVETRSDKSKTICMV
jgi:hypothetical protein